ncbi:MAG: hypothetical protein J5684_02445 [Eubacterium sp.]|nr:hypothetical protein [Eubacterium sp.]
MKRWKNVAVLVVISFLLSFAGCGKKEDAGTNSETGSETNVEMNSIPASEGDELIKAYSSFELKSEDLNNGVWDDVISNTDRGSNVSPQLSWQPVEGASVYAIYMIDLTPHYWIHWISDGVTETNLKQGWAPSSDYVGPYPPEGGPHTYDIYVIALKKPVERLKGGVDSQTLKVQEFIDSTDTDAEGNTGNIISIGHLSGTFTR